MLALPNLKKTNLLKHKPTPGERLDQIPKKTTRGKRHHQRPEAVSTIIALGPVGQHPVLKD